MKPRAKAAIIVIAFVVISIGLTWIWNGWLRGLYADFFTAVALKLHAALGFGQAPIAGSRQRYINFVPFIALLLVTPGLTLRRQTIGMGVGLLIISVSHLALNLTAVMTPGPSLPVVALLVSDAFPFLIWFIVAFPVLAQFIPSRPAALPTDDATNATNAPDAPDATHTGNETNDETDQVA